MTPTQLAHYRLDNDFPYFARMCLKIQDKDGEIVPLILNRAQQHVHDRMEEQLRDKGWVRVLILKGRQQGCSTLMAGRFYWKCIRHKKKRTFILSHQSDTTQKLLEMVEMMYEETPPSTRPKLNTNNRKHMEFKEIRSQYTVGTAGNADVGRGGTLQLFHGSEVGFWEKVDNIETGILQSVAKSPGTEIALESTANGMSGYFFKKCMKAMDGEGDYILIFVPWFWQDEYRRKEPSDGIMGYLPKSKKFGDEEELAELYNLDMEQIYWRRSEIIDGTHLWKFKQEYPCTAMEAFQTSGDTLIETEAVMKSMKCDVKDPDASLVIGVDPARDGDRTIIARRRGRQFMDIEHMKFEKGEEQISSKIAGRLAQIIDNENPDKVFIDVGEGWGVIDKLKDLGYGRIVEGIHFQHTAMADDIYANKRAEMWCTLRDAIEWQDGPISIPDDLDVQKDLLSMPGRKPNAKKIQMVSKDIIREKFGMSPDIGDAMALTYAYPVKSKAGQVGRVVRVHKRNNGKSELTSLHRRRNRNKLRNNNNYSQTQGMYRR